MALEPLQSGRPLEKPTPLFEQVPDELLEELSGIIEERIKKAAG
jgi:hypothetical protein